MEFVTWNLPINIVAIFRTCAQSTQVGMAQVKLRGSSGTHFVFESLEKITRFHLITRFYVRLRIRVRLSLTHYIFNIIVYIVLHWLVSVIFQHMPVYKRQSTAFVMDSVYKLIACLFFGLTG